MLDEIGSPQTSHFYVWGIRCMDNIIETGENFNGDGDYSDCFNNDVDWYHLLRACQVTQILFSRTC